MLTSINKIFRLIIFFQSICNSPICYQTTKQQTYLLLAKKHMELQLHFSNRTKHKIVNTARHIVSVPLCFHHFSALSISFRLCSYIFHKPSVLSRIENQIFKSVYYILSRLTLCWINLVFGMMYRQIS